MLLLKVNRALFLSCRTVPLPDTNASKFLCRLRLCRRGEPSG
jgi:hypothetical protein